MDVFIHDLLVSVVLFGWVAFVVFHLSKWFYRRYSNYRARKAIHYFAGGLMALLAPYVFYTKWPMVLASFGFFIVTYLPHAWGKRMDWFQIKDKYGEVYFTFSYFVLFSIFWDLNVWIAVTAALFMAFGDGITGIIKEHYYGKREDERAVKGLNLGNLAMFLVCAPIGYVLMDIPGFVAAIYASLIEAFYGIDDNITVPLGSAAIIWLLHGVGL